MKDDGWGRGGAGRHCWTVAVTMTLGYAGLRERVHWPPGCWGPHHDLRL